MTNYVLISSLLRGMSEDELVEISNESYKLLRNIYALRATPLIDSERALVEDGKYIAAIKAYKERNKTGLAEAKGAVDAYRDSL